jgi:hypothetical protein
MDHRPVAMRVEQHRVKAVLATAAAVDAEFDLVADGEPIIC